MKQKIGRWLPIAVVLQFGLLASSAQSYLFTRAETTITLNPGVYIITAYGAQGGGGKDAGAGGLGAEMEGAFYFTTLTTLTLLIGGTGGTGGVNVSGGGGGGSFVVAGSTPLVIAGGGGGGGYYGGGSGSTGTSGGGGGAGAGGGYGGGAAGYGGGGGGGGYSGGGGGGWNGGGGGGGSYIDSSALEAMTEISGIASPDGSPNGEIIITAVPEPTTLALAGLSGLSLLLVRRQSPISAGRTGGSCVIYVSCRRN